MSKTPIVKVLKFVFRSPFWHAFIFLLSINEGDLRATISGWAIFKRCDEILFCILCFDIAEA